MHIPSASSLAVLLLHFLPCQLRASGSTVAYEDVRSWRLGVCVAGSERPAAGRQDLRSVDSIVYVAVLQELHIGKVLHAVAIHS